MLSQSPSQIFKAQSREHREDENYRCLSTFTADENKKAFGKIIMLNDETLAPQKAKSFSLEDNTEVVLIPLVGTIDFDDKNYINTEEIQMLQLAKGATFELKNPYESELINYLQIRLSASIKNDQNFIKKEFDFKTRNTLFDIHENETTKISIGIFEGRKEGFYALKNNNGAFAFVINGAFEFQNRLLESRDGIAIWDIVEIEFEALSENAILLLIETALQE